MTALTAKRIAWSGPIFFGLSMIVPPGGPSASLHQDYGFQLAWLSVWGTMEGLPICILGFLANLSFLVALILLLTRTARGRPWPAFGFIFWTAILTAIAMFISRTWLCSSDHTEWFSFGFLFWLASPIMLAIGTWRLRDESRSVTPRGFDVIPIPAIVIPDNVPPTPSESASSHP